MSELTISASGFTIQPLVNLPDGPAELRWWYSRAFLDSDGTQVQSGSGTTGFWVTTPCSIASGLVTVDLDTLLWTTDDAQDVAPLTIFLSAGLFNTRGKRIQQLQIANKAQWVVPQSLAPTTTWEDFSIYNQATALYYYNPNYLNAPQTVALIDSAFDQHPASETTLGTVFTSVEPAITGSPVAWITDDPLVRDATKLQGINIGVTPPTDGQLLVYNQANDDWEAATTGFGTGNVVSNEVVSVDSEIVLFSGTGGQTIKRGSQTGLLRGTSGVVTASTVATADIDDDAVTNAKLANVPTATFKGRTTAATGDPEDLTATQATALLNNMVGDSGAGGTKGLAPAPAAGDTAAGKFLKADGTWAAPSGTGAPSTATYITQTPDGGLSAEQALSALSTGIMRVETATGVVTSLTNSAGIAANISDETGSGALVFGTTPTLVTPIVTSPQISLTAAHGSDDTYTGTTIVGLNAGATIAQWETVYLGGSSTWLLADANGVNTYPARGLAVAAYVDTNPATILVYGTVRNDAWAWTPGGAIYLSATPGGLTQTAPSTSGDQVQVVGYALTADVAFFDFNSTYLTVT